MRLREIRGAHGSSSLIWRATNQINPKDTFGFTTRRSQVQILAPLPIKSRGCGHKPYPLFSVPEGIPSREVGRYGMTSGMGSREGLECSVDRFHFHLFIVMRFAILLPYRMLFIPLEHCSPPTHGGLA